MLKISKKQIFNYLFLLLFFIMKNFKNNIITKKYKFKL